MEEVTNSCWNLMEKPVADRSIKNFQYNEFKENNISNISENENYEITIKANNYILFKKAYLHVKSKIVNPDNKLVTVSNNGINDFSTAMLFYENKEIERVEHLGVTTTIASLVDFSGDVSSKTASNMCWYLDTTDKASKQRFSYDENNKATKLKDADVTIENVLTKLKHNPNFNEGFLSRWQLTRDGKDLEKFIPLSRIFRFCRDIDKVLTGEIKIQLRKNTVKNILHGEDNQNYNYQITYLSAWVPELEPSLETKLKVEKLFLSNHLGLSYGWNYVNGYRSTLQITIDGSWRVTNMIDKVSGIYVVFSGIKRDQNYKNSSMVFDNMNLQSIHASVNNKQYPTKPYECNFTANNINYMRLYNQLDRKSTRLNSSHITISYA